MGDFLTRLVERTLGVAPLARPDLAPVFAPVARAEPASESFDATAPAPNSITEKSSRGSAPFRVADAIRDETRLTSDHVRVEPGERTSIAMQTRGANVQTATDSDVALQPEASPRRQSSAQDIEGAQAPAGMNHGCESLVREFFHHPSRTTHLSALDPDGATAPAAVNITIGRIEVRALSQPQAPRPAEPRANPLRSLDGYLRERNGGRG